MKTTHRARTLWILPPILIGVLVLVFVVGKKQPPQRVDSVPIARSVRTVTVPRVDLHPLTEGYGVVQPARVWSAVAQVNGRVIEMHPRLRDGEILAAGTLLLRIDPVDYQLALAQRKAELAELEVKERNTRDLLEIEQRNLALAQREAARLTDLADKGTTSRSNADAAERSMLSSRTAVQNLRNTLALLPSQRAVIEARLAQAERDLQNTEIKAPFNLRIADLAMETEQYVGKGQKLFAGDSVDRSEVVARVAISSLRHLFSGRGERPFDLAGAGDNLAEFADLHATIQMDMGGNLAEWQAEFVRFSDNIDSETRTIGVVVAIDKPFEKVIPGQRPPLSKGMFVKVRLQGRVQPGQLVVPRIALRDGRVMLVDDQDRLLIRAVEKRFDQDEISVIAAGLSGGEQLVVSDLVPAVAGMPLLPRPDPAMQQRLLQADGIQP